MKSIRVSTEASATEKIDTTCAYCGVGCGIEAEVNSSTREVQVKGDKAHPSSLGRLCSKGSSLGETLSLDSRLLYPEIDGVRVDWDVAIETVADKFRETIEQYGPESVAFYGSGQLLTEDYYVANKLMKGFIGSANIDTNSRLCMSSAVAGHKRAFGSDTVPNCYEDIDHTDLVVLVGSNTAWCHPIIFQRIRDAKAKNPAMRVVVIDPRKTATCDIADLHLPIAATTDVPLFNGLLVYLAEHGALDKVFIDRYTEGFEGSLDNARQQFPGKGLEGLMANVAEQCQIKIEDLTQFYQWFCQTDLSMTLYSQGVKQSSSGVDKVNAILNCHLATGRIGRIGCGPLSLTGQPNAMGGREVGGLANQLAAHMDLGSSSDRARVQRFWNAPVIADKPGLAAVELFEAVERGEVKAIWIMATNPVVSLPNADKVKRALEKCECVVVSDCVARSDTLDLAHIKLPAQGWSEKDGMVTNSERFISHQRALLPAAGEAKPDWWIVSRVAQAMGFEEAFNYSHQVEIFREHAALSGFENTADLKERDFDISALADISFEEYERFRPIQWPVNKAYPEGRSRFFQDGHFYTPNNKGQFIAVSWRRPKDLPNDGFPLVMNTGRLRDQWHTMTRSALAPRLNQHRPEPFVEVFPDDAKSFGLEDGAIAQLKSRWGAMYARVRVTPGQKPGNVFVPMHWSEQYARKGRMGAVVNPFVDPISGQPESKHTPVNISPVSASWYGVCFVSEGNPEFPCEYQVKINAGGYQRFELAGTRTPDNWLAWAQTQLQYLDAEDCQWQSYEDAGGGVYRFALIKAGKLCAMLMISPTPHAPMLPERNIAGSLMSKATLDEGERLALLSGLPAPGVMDEGAQVCACFNVGENRLRDLIEASCLSNAQQVGQACKAGTNCGSCIPEIKALIAEIHTDKVAKKAS